MSRSRTPRHRAAPLFAVAVAGIALEEDRIGCGLERSLGGGDARLSAVGEVRSGGHNPADTLRCVPALETVLIATSVLPERAPSTPFGVR